MSSGGAFVPELWAKEIAKQFAKKIDEDILDSLTPPDPAWNDLYIALSLAIGNADLRQKEVYEEAEGIVGSIYAAQIGRAPDTGEVQCRFREFKNWRRCSTEPVDGGKTDSVVVRGPRDGRNR